MSQPPTLPEFEKMVMAAGRHLLRLLPLAVPALPWLIPSLLIAVAPLFMTPPVPIFAVMLADTAGQLIALIGMVELFRRSCYATLGAPVPTTPYGLPDAEGLRFIGQVVLTLLLVNMVGMVLVILMVSSLPEDAPGLMFWVGIALWPMARLAGMVLAADMMLRLPGHCTGMPVDRMNDAVEAGHGLRFMIALGLSALIWPLDAASTTVSFVLEHGPGAVQWTADYRIPAGGMDELETLSVPARVVETLCMPLVTMAAAVWLAGWMRLLDRR